MQLSWSLALVTRSVKCANELNKLNWTRVIGWKSNAHKIESMESFWLIEFFRDRVCSIVYGPPGNEVKLWLVVLHVSQTSSWVVLGQWMEFRPCAVWLCETKLNFFSYTLVLKQTKLKFELKFIYSRFYSLLKQFYRNCLNKHINI